MTDHGAEFTCSLAAEADTLALGAALAPCIEPGLTIYLIGELGAGKTTLVRGLLRGLGFTGKVKSPTFSLVEVYEFSRLYLYHFDFYRFAGPEIRPQELREAGFQEYFNPQSVCLVEWPEKSNRAAGLPAADVRVVLQTLQTLQMAGSGRNVSIFAESEAGIRCLTKLRARIPP